MRQHSPLKMVFLMIVFGSAIALPQNGRTAANGPQTGAAKERRACDGGNGGLTLPAGFCASVFADNIGRPRHITVAPNGDVYANTWSSSYTDLKNAPGGYIVALRDTNRDGKAKSVPERN